MSSASAFEARAALLVPVLTGVYPHHGTGVGRTGGSSGK